MNSRTNESFENLVKGALLHDIGKIVIRTDESRRMAVGGHTAQGAKFLDDMGLGELSGFAKYHHEKHTKNRKDSLCMIVDRSDSVSSSERMEDDDSKTWDWWLPMASIFSKIHVPEKDLSHHESDSAFYGVNVLEESGIIMPLNKAKASLGSDHNAYLSLGESLGKDINIMKNNGTLSVEGLLWLLEKHASYIPSSTKESGSHKSYSDISLYDHLRTTAAIASALYRYLETKNALPTGENGDELRDAIYGKQKDERYLLIIGDISGIQQFIYNISSKGALRQLRGRSFYIDLLSHHVAYETVNRLGLATPNALLVGGGNFLILSQNTEEARNTISEYRTNVNKWLYENYGTALYLNMEYMPVCEEDLGQKKFGATIKGLHKVLGKAKLQPYMDLLEYGIFEPKKPENGECPVCRRNSAKDRMVKYGFADSTESPLSCANCSNFYKLGSRLLRVMELSQKSQNRAAALVFCDDEINEEDEGLKVSVPGGHYFYAECASDNLSEYVDEKGSFIIWNHWTSAFRLKRSMNLLNGIYSADNDMKELSERSVGDDNLGILKMDVDDMGKMIKEGFGESLSVSRYASFSRQMSYFFSSTVAAVCGGDYLLKEIEGIGKKFSYYKIGNNEEYGVGDSKNGLKLNVSIIYAGGDDLVLVGAWSDVLEAARLINYAFSLYVCNNPKIHISAGMAMQKHNFPISKFVELADEAEKKAKNMKDEEGKLAKNALSVGFATANWHVFDDALSDNLKALIKTSGNGRFGTRVSRGFLRKVMDVYSDYYIEKRRSLKVPKLAYAIARQRASMSGTEKAAFVQDVEKRLYPVSEHNTATWLIAATVADYLVRGE